MFFLFHTLVFHIALISITQANPQQILNTDYNGFWSTQKIELNQKKIEEFTSGKEFSLKARIFKTIRQIDHTEIPDYEVNCKGYRHTRTLNAIHEKQWKKYETTSNLRRAIVLHSMIKGISLKAATVLAKNLTDSPNSWKSFKEAIALIENEFPGTYYQVTHQFGDTNRKNLGYFHPKYCKLEKDKSINSQIYSKTQKQIGTASRKFKVKITGLRYLSNDQEFLHLSYNGFSHKIETSNRLHEFKVVLEEEVTDIVEIQIKAIRKKFPPQNTISLNFKEDSGKIVLDIKDPFQLQNANKSIGQTKIYLELWDSKGLDRYIESFSIPMNSEQTKIHTNLDIKAAKHTYAKYKLSRFQSDYFNNEYSEILSTETR